MDRGSRPARLLILLLVAATILPGASAVEAPTSEPLQGVARLRDLPQGEPAEAVLMLDAPMTGTQRDALEHHGLTRIERFDFIRAVGVRGTPAELRAALTVPGVRDVYPSEPLTPTLAESRVTVEADHVPRELGVTGANVTVAVVDSGIDADHPAFGDRVKAGLRFTDGGSERSRTDADGHGTHIAGIVGGNGAKSQDKRHRGIAPEAGLVGLDISHPFTTKNAIRAFEWIHEHHAEHEIRVVSNSWGRDRDDARYDPDDPVVRASNALVADGLVVVFSAGNRGDDPSSLTLEAMNPNVVTVGATDDAGRIEEYSSRGPAVGQDGEPLPWTKPDVVAPGSRIVSARTQDGDGSNLHALVSNPEARYYVQMNGTSMAAPHVAGIAALLLDKDPTLTPLAVKALLQVTAVDHGARGPDPTYGHGLANAHTALQALSADDGEQVVVTRERRVPVHEEGSLVAAANDVVVHQGEAQAPPSDGVEHTFQVPPRGQRVDLTFSWSSSTADFVVTLRHDGEELGPFQAVSGAQEVVVNASIPAPGTWTLHAEPRTPVSRTDYVLDGYVSVVETRVVDPPDRAGVEHAPPFRGDGDFFDEPRTPQDALLRAVDGAIVTPPPAVTLVLGLGSLAAGLALRTVRPPRGLT